MAMIGVLNVMVELSIVLDAEQKKHCTNLQYTDSFWIY